MQQEFLDTLFLNRKALAGVGDDATSTTSRRDISSGGGGGGTTTHTITMKETGASGGEEKCPIDDKTREAWLRQAKLAQSQEAQAATTRTSLPPQQPQVQQSSGWSWRIPFWGSSSSQQPTATATTTTSTQARAKPKSPLAVDREVSTIPRSSSADASTTACPVNNETETGSDAKTGNWVYPSEKMFFDAMKRKGHDTRAADMKAVVPIHNAVNERAWKEIREWERPYEVDGSCPGGPRLHSFMGESTKMSPKARLNTLLGYTAPFDRHDWVVDRCGTKIDYVIDFYAGSTKAAVGGKPSFYLDVRPKLNSWEGIKMRASRAVGLS